MILTFDVRADDIVRTDPNGDIASRSKGVVQCRFAFDAAWDGFGARVLFAANASVVGHIETHALDANGMATLSETALSRPGRLLIGAYSINGENRIVTKLLVVEVAPGAYGAANVPDPPQSIYEQILAHLDEIMVMTDNAANHADQLDLLMGNLADLTTDDKGTLVTAINEADTHAGAAQEAADMAHTETLAAQIPATSLELIQPIMDALPVLRVRLHVRQEFVDWLNTAANPQLFLYLYKDNIRELARSGTVIDGKKTYYERLNKKRVHPENSGTKKRWGTALKQEYANGSLVTTVYELSSEDIERRYFDIDPAQILDGCIYDRRTEDHKFVGAYGKGKDRGIQRFDFVLSCQGKEGRFLNRAEIRLHKNVLREYEDGTVTRTAVSYTESIKIV